MKINARDFLSWENLQFNVDKGVTLIQGFNHDDQTPEGSGKSAILNALAWGFFGKIPKDANIDEVIREGAKGCEVEIDLDGITQIVRTRKPNDLFMRMSGKEIRGKDARETQTQIEKFIGMSFETFCQSIYFAQNYPNKFVTANQENKGKILSEILDLEQFDRARKKANEQLKEVNDSLIGISKDVEKYRTLKSTEEASKESFKELIEQFKEDKVTKIKKLFEQLQNNESEAETFVEEFEKDKKAGLKKIKAELSELQEEQSELIEEISKIQTRLETSNIKELQKDKEALQTKQSELEDSKNSTKVKLGSIDMILDQQEKRRKDLKNAKKELESLEPKIKDKQWGVEGALTDLEHDEEVLAKALKALKNPSKENCPTCGQAWDGDLKHYEKEVDRAKKEKARTENMLKGYQQDIKDMKEQKAALEQVVQLLEKEVAEQEVPNTEKLEKKLNQLEDNIVEIKATVKELDSKIKEQGYIELELKEAQGKKDFLVKQMEKISIQYEELKVSSPIKMLTKFEERAAQLEAEIQAEYAKEPELLEKKLEDSKTKLKKISKNLAESEASYEEMKTKAVRLEALKDGYREVKAYTFQTVLNQLTRKANNYLAELFEQPVKIKFENVDMKIDVSVTIDGVNRTLGLYSGGQFRRIALAVDLALSDITMARSSNKLNLLILDEYCKDLSEVSMEKVLKLLQSRKGSTILIEHNSIFKSIVNNTFEVELINKISRRANAA